MTEEQCGWYWREDRSGQNTTIVSLSYADAKFVDGCRYIAAEPPTFPTRPSFTAPPKPELVLVRNRNGHEFYLIRGKPGSYSTHGLSSYADGELELIDELTGKPIQGE